ncbi:MAG TPA: tetratricopeptide repeat protein, partial [Streptomyces sp.]|nr:tetratricopeptide repeat protein [Streptomyces sp.]
PHVLALLQQTEDESTVAEALAVAVRLAISLHRDGDYLAALELASAAGPLAEPTLGREHRLVLTAQERVGRALLRLGRFEASAAVHRRVLAVRERLFGSTDLDTLSSCQGSYMPLLQLDQSPDGLALVRRALAGRTQLLGPDHPLNLRARSNLLTGLPVSELAHEIDAAEVPHPEGCASHLGREHAVTMHARLNYGFALFRLGRYGAARDQGRVAAADYARCLGPDHSLTLSTQTLCARSLYALGETAPAIELMIDVAARRERTLGAEHPHTCATYAFVEEYREDCRSTTGSPQGEDG